MTSLSEYFKITRGVIRDIDPARLAGCSLLFFLLHCGLLKGTETPEFFNSFFLFYFLESFSSALYNNL